MIDIIIYKKFQTLKLSCNFGKLLKLLLDASNIGFTKFQKGFIKFQESFPKFQESFTKVSSLKLFILSYNSTLSPKVSNT